MPMDELLARQMPHSLEAEQAALGAMLIDADCIKDVMDKLQRRTSISSRTGTSSRPSTPCSATPRPSTGSPWRRRCRKTALTTRRPPGATWSSSWRSPPPAPTSWSTWPSSGTRPCCGDWPRLPGISWAWSRRASARHRPPWRRRSRRFTPSAGAAAPRT